MNPLRKVLYILTLRCNESSRLQSEAMDRRLVGYERVALRLHLLSCKGCKRYYRYLRVYRAAVRAFLRSELGRDPAVAGGVSLSPESKSRMKSLLGGGAGG